MQNILFAIACLNLLVVIVTTFWLVRGVLYVKKLADFEEEELPQSWPLVSLLVAARNEERDIRPGVLSLLEQDYENLEIIAVNDRSTDRTGEILEAVAKEHPRLKVVHIETLPAGWLGKNHALQFAANAAAGEWLLFTDADVVMRPETVRKAVLYARCNQLDHLTMAPECDMPSWILEAFVVAFVVFFSIFTRPWLVKNPKSNAHVGIGAFSLLKRSVYQAIGGHLPLAMRPDDDLKLGKLVKLSGYSQEFVSGVNLIRVPWYNSLWEVVVGLEKNSFAAMEYNVLAVLAGTFAMLLFNVWPFIGVLIPSGWAQLLYGISCLLMLLMAAGAALNLRVRLSTALAFPLVAAIFVYIQWRAMFITLKTGGIRWRETFYPLAELKANRL